ncbi:MAG: shikimate dehydrogenase [Bacteroidales bacterium]|nr:shikimate dehydrogenase [Bacteroidales bacterium]
MRLYGLIGYPLSHSFSPGYFKEKFDKEQIDAVYKSFSLEDISEFPSLIEQQPDLCGLNVTIPYKEQIIPYLDDVQGDAAEIRAVNTIAFDRSQSALTLIGFNTDAYGFEQSIRSHLGNQHTKALILGTGGSSKTVAFVLNKLNIAHVFVTRRERKENQIITYNDLTVNTIKEYRLIINTTPVGMYPNISKKPEIPYEGITPSHMLFDLIYNPPLTSFLQEGKRRGAAVENGLNMLKLQAEASWAIWTRYQP